MAEKKNLLEEVLLPDGIESAVKGNQITVIGKKGEVSRVFNFTGIQVQAVDKKIIFSAKKHTRNEKKSIGSIVSHVKNMLRGVTEGHKYILKICSGHFPMSVSVTGNKFIVKNFLGEKVPRVLEIKKGVKVTVENDNIHVESLNKELAGQVSADIEQLMRRPDYDPRVFMDGIYMVNKDGEDLK